MDEERTQGAHRASSRGVLGYVCVGSDAHDASSTEFREQVALITETCRKLSVPLVGIVCERVATPSRRVLDRPALDYALERIEAGEATGLIVEDLSKLSRSAADLGPVLVWFTRIEARLVAIAEALDTATAEGRVAVRALTAVAETERELLAERSRNGLLAARESARLHGRPAVSDDHELHARITDMRARGMTLQAIADRLNQEGVPTVRGGLQWRPSSVQSALGYKRRRHRKWLSVDAATDRGPSSDEAWETR